MGKVILIGGSGGSRALAAITASCHRIVGVVDTDPAFSSGMSLGNIAVNQGLFTWPRDTATVDFSRPDATVDLLRLRIEDFSRFMLTRPNGEGAAAAPPGGEPPPDGDRIQITVLPR